MDVVCVVCSKCDRIVAADCLNYIKSNEDYQDVGRMVVEAFRRGNAVHVRPGPVTISPCNCKREA